MDQRLGQNIVPYEERVKGLNVPRDQYLQAKENFALPCVDIILRKEPGASQNAVLNEQQSRQRPAGWYVPRSDIGVLLGRRANEPLKGQLCFISGRVAFGESLEEAAHRKVMEETGLAVELEKLVGVYSLYYGSEKRSDIDIIFLGRIVSGEAKTDEQHSGFTWVYSLDVPMPEFVKQALSDSGVFGGHTQNLGTVRFFAKQAEPDS